MKKRVLTVVVCLCLTAALVLSLAGCNMVTVNEQRQKDQIVAVVNGDEITRADFDDMMASYLYGYYGYTQEYFDSLSDEEKDGVRKYVLDQMVDQLIEYQDAIANGYALTAEEEKQIEDDFNAEVENTKANYRSILEGNKDLSPEEVETKYQEYLEDNFSEEVFNWDREFDLLKKSQVATAYEQDIRDSVEVTEDEIKGYYDCNVQNQKNMIEKDTYGFMNILGGNTIVLVYPDDVRRVQNLLVGFDSETETKIATIRANGDDEAADTARSDALAEIQDKAEEVYEEVMEADVKTSEEFAEFMDEYSDDKIGTSEAYRLDGYIVYGGMTSDYLPEEAVNASMEMSKEGEISKLVESDSGFHILRIASFPPTVVPFEDAHDQIYEALLSSKQSEAIYNNLNELREKADITCYYDRLR